MSDTQQINHHDLTISCDVYNTNHFNYIIQFKREKKKPETNQFQSKSNERKMIISLEAKSAWTKIEKNITKKYQQNIMIKKNEIFLTNIHWF